MRTLFITLCLCLFCGAFAKANPDEWGGNYGTIDTGTGGGDTLLNPPTIRPPVRLFAHNPSSVNTIQITFNQALVNARISVYDHNNNLVYQSTVSTVPGSQHAINTTGWNKGRYTLRIHVDGGVDDVFTFEY